MRPNNRQRPRGGGRNGGGGGGGGGGQHYQKQHTHNPNRQPNRNQLFDSSGPDVRVRGNAHQVFDKYQALAREAAASGDRILSEAYWQYAEHYFRMIQTMGGFGQRNNQGWGDEGGEGNAPQQGQGGPQQGQNGQPQSNGDGAPSNSGGSNGNYNSNGGSHPQQGERQDRPERNEQAERYERADQNERSDRNQRPDQNDRQGDRQQGDRQQGDRQQGDRQNDRPERYQRSERTSKVPESAAPVAEAEPGLGDVAFLKGGRSAPVETDPAVVEQPDVPEFTPPPPRGRRNSGGSS